MLEILRILPRTLALLLLFAGSAIPQPSGDSTSGWMAADEIRQRITAPHFPDRDFFVTRFGARGNGVTNSSRPIALAIDACHRAGGGRVVVPPGIYLTGPIHLKSGVNLYVPRGTTIRFLPDPRKYLPPVFTRWEGVECMNYSPLIYAIDQENVAVTGGGILDGQGSQEQWWPWKGSAQAGWRTGMPRQDSSRALLFALAEKGVPPQERVFGEGGYLRPNFFGTYRCKNVLVQGVTFRNSPMWFLHPVLCSNVIISGVTVEGLGPNNDGCDPESCTDVLIDSCTFSTGDDCIAIKSGRNADGRRVNIPALNTIIRRCTMHDGHGGVVIGSEISGGVRNVFAEDCVMESPHLDRVLRIKTNAVRGGTIENVFMRNVHAKEVTDAVLKIDYFYEEGEAGAFLPVVRNINLRDVTCAGSRYALWIRAYKRSPVRGVRVEQCVFENVREGNVLENVEEIALVGVRGIPAGTPR